MWSKEQLLNKAMKIADKAHRGQTDKFGTPYIGHVIRVMNDGKTYDEKIVGVLHDVIEDCPEITYEYLLKEGFPNEIVFAIDFMKIYAFVQLIHQRLTADILIEDIRILGGGSAKRGETGQQIRGDHGFLRMHGEGHD